MMLVLLVPDELLERLVPVIMELLTMELWLSMEVFNVLTLPRLRGLGWKKFSGLKLLGIFSLATSFSLSVALVLVDFKLLSSAEFSVFNLLISAFRVLILSCWLSCKCSCLETLISSLIV